jgi:uncharacterized protein with HEPN domain
VFSISQVDHNRLRHIDDSLAKAIHLLSSISIEDFVANEILTLAIIHLIELVGEGSRKVSPLIRERFPEVDWLEAARMRHKLVHDYLDIDLQIVWDVVQRDFPRFQVHIQEIFSQLGLSNSAS